MIPLCLRHVPQVAFEVRELVLQLGAHGAELGELLRDSLLTPRSAPLIHARIDLVPHLVGGLVVLVVWRLVKERPLVSGELVVLAVVELRILRLLASRADVRARGEAGCATTQAGHIVDGLRVRALLPGAGHHPMGCAVGCARQE